MRYRLGVERTTSDHWFAWVLDLPGCYSAGQTRAAAISNAGAAISAYHKWIARHRNEPLFDDPYMDIHVAEVFQTTEPVPGIETRAFFEDDRKPLGEDEAANVLGLLASTRADLVALCHRPGDGGLPEPVADMIAGVAAEERLYLDRLDLPLDEDGLDGAPIEVLNRIHVCMEDALKSHPDDRRVVTRDGELWSIRKLVRRVLWLERDRAQQITRLVGP